MTKKEKVVFEYQMADNCHRSKEQQDAVLEWINSDKRYSQDGRKPTVEEFIKAAFTKGTPLYKARVLERDKEKAAQTHYIQEAQYYLRHVEVVRIDIRTGKSSGPVKAFLPITVRTGGIIEEKDYKTAKRIANNEIWTKSVLSDMYADLLAWKQRYEDYAEFFMFKPVISAIDKISKKIETEIKKTKKKGA